MPVYKDNNKGNWYFQINLKNKKGEYVQIKRRGFEKKKDAVKAMQKQIDENNEKTTYLEFQSLAQQYMDYSLNRKKKSTITKQNNLINKSLIPYFSNMNIFDISPKDIDAFYQTLLPKYSNATMKNIRTTLSAIFNHAISFYDLKRNVVKIVQLPRKEQTTMLKYWTQEQFNQFIECVDNYVYKVMFIVLFWSGLRKGELLALRYSDIDVDNKTLTILRNWNGEDITSLKNTSSERVIGIPQHVCDEISELIAYQKDKYRYLEQTDYIFSVRNPEKPMSPTNVNLQLKYNTDKANLPHIRVHHFRHSHATMLINYGVSLYVVSRHLGHENIQTTANVYGHLYPNSEKEVSDLLDKAYNQK